MEIKLHRKTILLALLIILIIIFSLPLINLDRDIQFSCTSINEENRIVLKCFVEPFDARFISERMEIRLRRRFDFQSKKYYLAKINKIDRAISYYNGIAYRSIYCEVPKVTFDDVGIIHDGVVKIEKISTFKLTLISILNWLEPYSGEKIILY